MAGNQNPKKDDSFFGLYKPGLQIAPQEQKNTPLFQTVPIRTKQKSRFQIDSRGQTPRK